LIGYLKALVIGYGSIGRRHIQNLSKIKNMEIMVCTKRRSDKFLRTKKCRIVKSVNEGIKENPDFGIISNETIFHTDTALKLASAGISFFSEKPLSHSFKHVPKLLQIVKKKKLVTMMGCDLRFNPCIKKIKELVKQRKIGRIISAQVELGSYLPDWHPYEDYRLGYAARKDLGGGVLLTCIHELDYLFWFLGKVKEAISFTGKFSDLELDVEDLSSIILRFDNNVIAEVHLDFFQKPTYRRCKMMGTKGTIYWDSEINKVKIFDSKKKKWKIEYSLPKNYNDNYAFSDELNHFLYCLNKKKESINPVSEGAKVLQIVEAIKKSSKVQKMVKVS